MENFGNKIAIEWSRRSGKGSLCWLWVLVAEIKWVPATCPCLMSPYLYLIDSNICEDICGRYSTTQLLTCPKLIKYNSLINQANLFRIFILLCWETDIMILVAFTTVLLISHIIICGLKWIWKSKLSSCSESWPLWI